MRREEKLNEVNWCILDIYKVVKMVCVLTLFEK